MTASVSQPGTTPSQPAEPAGGMPASATTQHASATDSSKAGSNAAAHNEATIVAFADFIDAETKQQWTITLRQGVTPGQIKGMLDAIKETIRLARERDLHYRLPKQTTTPEPAPRTQPAPAGGSATAPAQPTQPTQPRQAQPAQQARQTAPQAGAARGSEPLKVARIVVTGTQDAPVVEMYSNKANLKWPVIKAPVSLVAPMLAEQLHADEDRVRSQLSCGHTAAVDWVVEWETSPKNDKWKDVTNITVITTGGR